MNNYQKASSNLLIQIANFVKKMSDEEFTDFVDGKITIDINIKGKKSKSLKQSLIKNSDIELLVSKLRTLESRSIGTELLEKYNFTKSSLKLIAKFVNVAVTQRDNIESLKEKIIEATIGFRLRSEAIQNGSETKSLTKKEISRLKK